MPRAVLFTGAGKPLELVEFSTPQLRPGELLVRVSYCTLCRSDLHTHAGRRAEATPTVLGHEIMGRIEAFGPESSRADSAGVAASIGDRITWAVAVGCGNCYYCLSDLPQKCERLYKYGHQRWSSERPLGGALADFIVLIPGTYWLRIPDEIPDYAAAPANCAIATVAALFRYGEPVSGRDVLVLGAGVLGVTACAMASSAGARTVMVSDPLQVCRERAMRFGATHAFATDLKQSVTEVTHGRGADLVLELAGSVESAESALALVRTGGTVALAGTVVPVGAISLDPELMVRRMLTIRGIHNYHPRDLATALGFLAGAGRPFPWRELVAAEYPLNEAEQAFVSAHTQIGVRVAVVPGNSGGRNEHRR